MVSMAPATARGWSAPAAGAAAPTMTAVTAAAFLGQRIIVDLLTGPMRAGWLVGVPVL